MEKKQLIKKLLHFGSYVLVAALASTLTWFLLPGGGKLAQLYAMIDCRYVVERTFSAMGGKSRVGVSRYSIAQFLLLDQIERLAPVVAGSVHTCINRAAGVGKTDG